MTHTPTQPHTEADEFLKAFKQKCIRMESTAKQKAAEDPVSVYRPNQRAFSSYIPILFFLAHSE